MELAKPYLPQDNKVPMFFGGYPNLELATEGQLRIRNNLEPQAHTITFNCTKNGEIARIDADGTLRFTADPTDENTMALLESVNRLGIPVTRIEVKLDATRTE